jgi:hypothetical protein
MGLGDIALVIVLVALVLVLIHAANVLSGNSYQRIRAQEDLAGRFPSDMPFAQKLDLIDRYGISPSARGRIWGLILTLCGVLLFLLWQRW